MLTSRLAGGIVLTINEAVERVYLQSRGFVCKRTHVLGKQTMGFPSFAAWRIQAIRRCDKKSKSVGATHQCGINELS